jgi:hypothetical protein
MFWHLLYEEESSINCAEVVKRLETCLSPSSAFNSFIYFHHGTLKIIDKGFPGRNNIFSNLKVLYY